MGLRCPDSGRTTALNAAAYCASVNSIPRDQRPYEWVGDMPADHYGSEGHHRRGGALTTKADHNGTRHEPIPADALVAQHQVSDCLRQSVRTLQAKGQTWFR